MLKYWLLYKIWTLVLISDILHGFSYFSSFGAISKNQVYPVR